MRTKLSLGLTDARATAAAVEAYAESQELRVSIAIVDLACRNAKQTRFLGPLSTERVVSIISLAQGGES